jgi:putative peptidoglycan lipid II flippase
MRKFQFKSVVALANAKLSVKFAAILLSSSFLISALLGIFRDRYLNSLYLDTYPTGIDAYTAAFTIPDFMFFILVSGALAVTFIPVFNQRLVTGNKKSAWELSTSMLNFMALITIVASILIMIFADPLIRYVVSPGLDESGMALAINMMRVIAINPFLFAIATVLSSIQQAVGRFVFYALAPALYNIGILIGIFWFSGGINIFGVQIFAGGIMGVALGVVLGAVFQVIVSLIGLFGLGFSYEFKIYWKNLGFRKVLKLLPARAVDQGIDYVSSIVNTNLSSRMGTGVLRSYQQATTLRIMPVNLIGVAISTAFFPKLTEEVGAGKDEDFRRTLRQALRMIIWIAMPITIIMYFTRGYVVNFIKTGGDALIADILGAAILLIFLNSVFHIATRGFYARQNTKTPLMVSIVGIGLNIGLAIFFSMVLKLGPQGLAYAGVIGAVIEVTALLSILHMQSRWSLLNARFWSGIARMLFATFIAGSVAYVMTKFFPLSATDNSFFDTFPKFLLISGTSVLTYLIAGYFLKIEEGKPIIRRFRNAIFRNVK